MKLQVYLNFSGEGENAANFYAQALETKKPDILKFGDLPPSPNFPPIPEEYKDFVMHTEVRTSDITIQISDIIPNMTPVPLHIGNNMSIALIFDSSEEILKVYNNLTEDAEIIMPLGETMWAEKYANFIDKFGVPWQLNYRGNKAFTL